MFRSPSARINIFYSMVVMYWFAGYVYMPTMTPYLKDIGVSYSMIGLIGSAYGIAQMLLRLPLGIMSDRLHRRRIFINIGLFIALISSLGFYFTENALLIFILRGLAGMGASTWVIMTVLFSSYFPRELMASRTSLLSMFNHFGQVVAMLLGATLAGYAGYKSPFLLSAVVVTVAFIMSFMIEEKAPPETKTPISIKDMLQVGKNHYLLTMSVICILVQIIIYGATITFLPEVARNLGATTAMLGYLTSIATIPRLIASFVCGIILAKVVNERKLLAYSFLLVFAAMVLTPFSPNMPVLFIVTFFGGFGVGMVFTMTISLCTSEVDDSLRSTGMGFFQAVNGVGMTTGPVIIGFSADHFGLTVGYLVAAAVAIIGILVSMVFLRRK